MSAGPTGETAYLQVMRACKRAAVPVVAFSFAINVLMLTTAIYMLQVYDRVLTSYSLETLVALSLIALLALLVLGALEIVRSRLLIALGDWIYSRLSPVLLVASVEMSAAKPARAREQGLRDLDQIRNFIGGPSIVPVLDVPWVPIFMIAIFIVHPWLGWISLAGAAVLFMLALLAEIATRSAVAQANAAQQLAYRQAETANRNAEAIQAMGMLPSFARQWTRLQNFSSSVQKRANDLSSTIGAVARFLRLALQIAILGVGAYLVLAGDMRAGGMIAAAILMGRALAPVEQSITTWKGFVGFRDACGRVAAMVRSRGDLQPTMPMPRPRGKIVVDNVTLRFDPEAMPILSEVSFELEQGEVLGLIGPSAAGKTSLARILVGVWKATDGRVLLDGLDVAEWEAADRGQYVGYLPQNVELFAGSVTENIARFRDLSATDQWENVIRAAELAGVHEVVKSLSKGYETQIGEGGAILSGGQRQRVALARALFGDPVFVVLDEPNANLDRDGEDALERTIRQLKSEGKTVVVIAHRPQILSVVDKILLLREGRVEQYGPRADVLASLGARQAAAAAQAGQPQLPRAPRRVRIVTSQKSE